MYIAKNYSESECLNYKFHFIACIDAGPSVGNITSILPRTPKQKLKFTAQNLVAIIGQNYSTSFTPVMHRAFVVIVSLT